MTNNQLIENNDISFKELYFIIRKNIVKLFFSTFFFVLVAVLYIVVSKPVFNSTGSIIVEEEDSSMSPIFDMDLGVGKNFLDNEIAVLKSRTTAERTIQSLFDSEHKNNLYLFNTRKFEGNKFNSFFRKFFLLDINNPPINKFGESISDSLFNIFVKKFREEIVIANIRNTDVLTVTYSSNDRFEAAFIANTLIQEYQNRDKEWASGEMSYLITFLNDQLIVKENELNEIEEDLKEFQEEEHIYGLDENSKLLLSQLTIVESDYYNTEARRNILSERKKYFENQLNKDEKEFTSRVSNTIDIQLYSIRQELSTLEAEYISTKSREGESHPAVLELNRKIKSLKNVLDKKTKKYVSQGVAVANPIEYRQAIMDSVINFDVYISAYESKLFELENLVTNYEKQLSSLPEKYLQFSKYQRDRIILNETYSLMKQKLEEAKINEASQLGKIRLVDPAFPALEKAFPQPVLILFIFLFLGIFFGIIIIFIFEYLDQTITKLEDIEKYGSPVLAIIPAIDKVDSGTRKKKKGYRINLKLSSPEKIERRLLTHEDPKSPISEAYRSLRTSLSYDDDNEKTNIILVSSSGPGEGKTTTVANLAITYANMGKKTLLIDADLRKPVIHKMFKSQLNKGVTNFLSGQEKDVNNLIYESNVHNLSIIQSGMIPPNPSELLASKKMDEFVEQLKNNFDIILFDTPPMIAVTDAFVINRFVNKILVVIRASVTEKGALERTVINMNNMGDSIDGFIFNGVDSSSTYGGGYYYNYYQYYYGQEDK